ncbi:MAG: hypothetical protein ACOCOC_04185 [Prevotella sp.]
MNNRNLMALPLVMTLTSCEEDGSLSAGGWIGTIVFIILVVVAIVNESVKSNKVNEEAMAKGDDPHSYKDVGNYAGGHPNVDKELKYIHAKKNGQVIEFWQGIMNFDGTFMSKHPEKVEGFEIPIDAIEDIRIEDKTSVERQVGAGRMFLVGMYAFAWKKKKKNEMAFVVIKWKKGKFENETLFVFEEKGAMTKANTARNELIKMCE